MIGLVGLAYGLVRGQHKGNIDLHNVDNITQTAQ